MRLLISLLLFGLQALASPIWRTHTSASYPATRLDWLSRLLAGEGATKQGEESTGGWLWGWGWTWSESIITVMQENATVTFPSKPAAFGLRIVNAPGLSGHLIPTAQLVPHCPSAAFSCPPLCPHYPFPHLENEGWIALIQRGECSFVEKVREAQRLGAVGVVVGGNEKGNEELITMYSPGDATDIGIPSSYVTFESYKALLKLWEKSNHTTSGGHKALNVLLGEDEAWQWPVFTFSLLLLLPSILTLLTLVVHRIRQQRAEVRERAPEDIVQSLPTRVWNGTHWDKDETLPSPPPEPANGEAPTPKTPTVEIGRHKMHWAWFETQVECAICLSAFERGDRVRVLPCGHVFHIEEIDGWLVKQKKLCPICKTDVTQPPVTPPTSPGIRAFPRAVARSSPDTSSAQGPPTEHTPLLAVPTPHQLHAHASMTTAALPPTTPGQLERATQSEPSVLTVSGNAARAPGDVEVDRDGHDGHDEHDNEQ